MLQQLFRESMIREIEWKQMSMYPMANVRPCLLFLDHIFADTKRDWAIENSRSPLIADYFQWSKFQQALVDDLPSCIDQLG